MPAGKRIVKRQMFEKELPSLKIAIYPGVGASNGSHRKFIISCSQMYFKRSALKNFANFLGKVAGLKTSGGCFFNYFNFKDTVKAFDDFRNK